MSTAFQPCTTVDSGWRPAAASTPNFRTEGRDLVVELRRWNAADAGELRPAHDLVEEMGAVLEGRFELVSDDDRYALGAGEGILVPAGAARRWKLLTESGVLYRVFPR